MSLVSVTLATILDPLFPIAALGAMVALLAALVAAFRKKVAPAVGWLLVSGCCAAYAKVSAPIAPDRREAVAVGDSRALHSAEVAYSMSNGGFFGQISCLGSPPSCGWPAGETPFIDVQLAALSTKQGYVRSFVAGAVGKGKPDPGIATYVYVATPVKVGDGSRRGFAIDHTGLLCVTTDGSVPPIANGALSPTCTPLK